MKPCQAGFGSSAGQSTTETILLLPFFLTMVFGLLQMGQLTADLLVTQYSAYSVARQMVQDNSINAASYRAKFDNLMTAGMRFNNLYADPVSGMMPNLTVHACSEVSAFPLVAEMLSRPMRNYNGDCGAENTMGPFSLQGRKFIVHGRATVRMNYRPT